MQKYKSNITTTSGAAVRGVPVLVIDEAGNNAALFLDRAGTVPAPNPLTTGPDGVFYFYAVNGRYGLRTTVDGVTITDDDVVLMMDPEEITVAGPIAEAVAAAQAAATAAELAVANSGIPGLVAAAQNAVVDANNAVSLSATSANNAAISKTGADSARDAAVAAKNAAEAALDSFDDRYLGAKAVAPATDNDGGALLAGALYWDTALPGMRSWNGSVWVTLPAATKASVGLANVDNTSDANKPVSTATQTALNGKESTIAAGTATQYWRGDKTWRDFFTDVRAATLTGLSTATNAVITATDTVLSALGKLQKQVSDNLATLTSHTGNTSNPHGVTKVQVGLGNVDNTSDANKPISNATQTALDGTVKTTGDQTVGGNKTFSGSLVVSGAYFNQTAYSIGFILGPGVGTGNTNIQGFQVGSGKALAFITNAGVGAMSLDGSGNFTASGNITAYSDIRLKTDITKITDALSKVSRLSGYTYTRKDTGQRQTGVVAQEVQEVLPEAVIDNGEHLSVAYGNMVGLLIEAIKELKSEVDQLKGK